MKNIIKIAFIIVAGILVACNNQEPVFPDYYYTSVYFPIQYPARTLILGEYSEGDNSMDLEGRFEIGVTMSGVYSNKVDRKVYFEIDNSLLDNVANVRALPATHYTLELASPVTIPAGSMKGRITVQLTEAFFNDTLAIAPVKNTNYVIPLVITQIENLDSLLSGIPAVQSPRVHAIEDWEALPQDFTMYGIKYMNEYHGHYLRRGVDVMTKSSGETVSSTYHADYVVRDELVMLTTSGRNKVMYENMVRRGTEGSPGNVKMELNFSDGNTGSISGVRDGQYNVSGVGKFVPDGDEWGGKAQDVIYLDYSYTDVANSETHAVKDTLVIRDRAAIFEEYSVALFD
ncbi:MAG: DUF1735 domain-containing protein [Cyclobacteriaceae bacterium]|nr:DUF1735 domain-containing protein [Cyclobacteriaceae bacterium]